MIVHIKLIYYITVFQWSYMSIRFVMLQQSSHWSNHVTRYISSVLGEYALKNVIHIYNEIPLLGSDIIYNIHGRIIRTSPLCMIMWIKSSHSLYMPMIPTQCNVTHMVDFIICEHTHQELNSSIITGEKTMLLVMSNQLCPIYWTFIVDHCFRVWEQTRNDSDVHNQIEIHPFQSGIDTIVSQLENKKALLYRVIQHWVRNNHFTSSYVWHKRPVQLMIKGHCTFLQVTVGSQACYHRTDCAVYSMLRYGVFQCFHGAAHDLHSGITFKYNIKPLRYIHRCGFAPHDCGLGYFDNMKVQMGAYLAKSSDNMKHNGIAVSTTSGKCVTSYPDVAGNPPVWHISGNWSNCSSVRYKLLQTNLISTPNKTTGCSRNNQVQCNDGTCVVLNRKCDGVTDCPDGSDEQHCPPACTQASVGSSCFDKCLHPICKCTFLYLVSSAGACGPIWRVDDRPFLRKNSTIALKMTKQLEKITSNLHHHDDILFLASSNFQSNSSNLPTDFACIYQRELLDLGPNLRYCYRHECPAMYKCYHSYCIPYRYVCDGQIDCPSGEDEERCENLICPGLLKCALDNVCISQVEVCDSAIHCLISKDDEWMCDLPKCPEQCSCLGMTLTCSHLNLTNIPQYHSNIRALGLPHNSIKSFSHASNSYLTLLRLDLSANKMYKPNAGTFQNLHHLWYFYLDANPLHTIQGGAFVGLLSLRAVTFESCHIYAIMRYGFSGLLNVMMVDVSRTNLQLVQSFAFTGMCAAETLNLSSNSISYLHEFVFAGLPMVTTIDLSNNPILDLAYGVFNHLQHLSSLFMIDQGLCYFVHLQLLVC